MRSIFGGVGVVVLACLLGACREEDHISVDNVERALAASIEEASSLAVTPSCPGNIRNDAGTHFRCTVAAHGRTYVVRGEVTAGTEDPWEFDEDDLQVGPSTLTCAQLREDGAWNGAAEQLLAREAVQTPAESRVQQVRAVAELFRDECEDGAPGLHPYPAVAARVASF